MGDHAVRLVGGVHRLAQRRDVHVGQHEGVEGVVPFPGRGRGVGRLAVELHHQVVHRQHERVDGVLGVGVHHHRQRRAGEGPGVDEVHLAADLLLGRGAQHRHPEAQFVGQGGQGQARPDGGGRDQVVAAGVAHAGQGIQFGADDHLRPGGSRRGRRRRSPGRRPGAPPRSRGRRGTPPGGGRSPAPRRPLRGARTSSGAGRAGRLRRRRSAVRRGPWRPSRWPPGSVRETVACRPWRYSMGHWHDVSADLADPSRSLRAAIPDAWAGFAQMHQAAMKEGVLSAAMKEVIALVIAVSDECDGCIAAHARGGGSQGSDSRAGGRGAGGGRDDDGRAGNDLRAAGLAGLPGVPRAAASRLVARALPPCRGASGMAVAYHAAVARRSGQRGSRCSRPSLRHRSTSSTSAPWPSTSTGSSWGSPWRRPSWWSPIATRSSAATGRWPSRRASGASSSGSSAPGPPMCCRG